MPAFVQGAKNPNTNGTVLTSLSVTLGATVGVGNTVCVAVKSLAANGTPSVTDDKSNTYTGPVDNINRGDGVRKFTTWYATVTNSPQTITMTMSPTGDQNIAIIADEFSGVAALDVHAAQDQGGVTGTDSVTSGTATAAAADLVWGVSFQNGLNTLAHGTSFADTEAMVAGEANETGGEYRVLSGGGSTAATFTPGGASTAWDTLMLAFLPAVAHGSYLPLLAVGYMINRLMENAMMSRRRFLSWVGW